MMTRKKRLFLIAGTLAGCVCLTLGVLALLPPRTRVTNENYDCIEQGMSNTDVQTIFGEPAELDRWPASRPGQDEGVKTCRCWDGGEIVVLVAFDDDDRVVDTIKGERQPGFFGMIRRWLHLR
jgi:hypothetical protein